MNGFFSALFSLLQQPSTIKGLVTVATAAVGHQISPEAINGIIASGACIYGLVDILRDENKPVRTIITR